MPTYQFRCPACGTVRELFCRVSEQEANRPQCCNTASETVIQPTYGYVQSECHYKCPATGQSVTSWKQRRETFARHGLNDASDYNVEKEIAKARKKKADSEALARQMPHYGEQQL